jgi:hypothetical protein
MLSDTAARLRCMLPSEVLKAAMPQLSEFGANHPAGYRMQIGGD